MKTPPALAIAVLLFTFGCGGGGSTSSPSGNPVTPQNADISGPWQFTATSTANPGLTPVIVEANLTDLNASVSSSAFVALNSPCGPPTIETGGVSGSVSGNNVSATASFNSQSVALAGTVSGGTMTGTYTASGACGADAGKFTATLFPKASGTYSGTVTSNSTGQAIPVTAHIAVDASLNITGSASVTSVCFNQLTLTGTQIGAGAQMTATNPQGSNVTFLLISNDATFGSITGAYSIVAGNCAGDSGSGTC